MVGINKKDCDGKVKPKKKNFDVTIGPNDGHNRSIKKGNLIEKAAKAHHLQRSPARLLKNEMLELQKKEVQKYFYLQIPRIVYTKFSSLDKSIFEPLKFIYNRVYSS